MWAETFLMNFAYRNSDLFWIDKCGHPTYDWSNQNEFKTAHFLMLGLEKNNIKLFYLMKIKSRPTCN